MIDIKKRALLSLVFFAILAPLPGCYSYNMELRSFATAFFHDQFKYFTFHSRPILPYEFGSIYSHSILENFQDIKKEGTIHISGPPETWIKESLTEKQKSELAGQIVETLTLQFPSHKPFAITDNLDIDIVLPGLKEELAPFGAENIKSGLFGIAVTADKVTRKRLNWDALLTAIKNGQIKEDVADIILTREYVIACEELFATGYKVQIDINRHMNPELAFALEDIFERHITPKNIFEFAFLRTNPSVFSTKKPMAIGALWKKRPGKEDMEKIHPPPIFENIETWEPVQIPFWTLTRMENVSYR